ncbi:lytic transglycosylase domain-containing protein [Mucilaginibacter sp. BJC16-A38]|uniref:lytic transglycosylase domain-containing protein n=1 Tax=Mucilaginibacter phenanthrenivorans TaxID=1234842 RepID=UPI002157E82B|nr:lytic transglycosylase domain-containing protein [Mucilaginibacter phenanthrenivorans]MCR8559123.1 lytic transglycosylase domain-containing protein [Mucilaginibacter phenanthrenivorans]
MTKRHLITCSVIVLLVIISAINICGTKAVPTANIRNEKAPLPVAKTVKLSPRISTFIYKSNEVVNEYSFANEAVPVRDAGVTRKLKRSLQMHSFKCVQSNILQSKAEKLFPIIEPILKAYGIPDDFKYIPLVESGLCEGTSPRGARGLWQFMPGTARTYGLKVGHGIDERLNIRKSTGAACKYIKELYVEFNSWTLAAAAYNNGSIKLAKSINRQNEDNYFRMHLNRETGNYVYNLIAMKAIITQPKKYGYDYYAIKDLSSGSFELLAVN